MAKKQLKNSFIIAFFVMISGFNLNAQQGSVEVNQDKEIDALLRAKKEVNATDINYRIQIYSGNRSGAQNAKTEFLSSFGEWRVSTRFETPNYKIWVGNFKTRLEADRALAKIKRKFANAFYFKPKKKE